MKQKTLQWIIIAIFIGVGIVLIYGTWSIGASFTSLMADLSPEYISSLFAAVFTALAGVSAVVVTQWNTKSRQIEDSHRPKKVEIYSKFVSQVLKQVREYDEEKKETLQPTDDLVKFLVKWNTELIVWGSQEVVKAYLDFRKVSEQDGNVFRAMDNILKAIRKDIGLKSWKLTNMELIQIILKNPDEIETFL